MTPTADPTPLPTPLDVMFDRAGSGAENMRRDSNLLRRCASGALVRTLRLYWFRPPCMSVGRTQAMTDIDVEACRRDGIDVVRRPSGGRAVLHENEVTYAVVCRSDDPVFGGTVLESCSRIHRAVARGLDQLGVTAIPRAVPDLLRADALSGAMNPDCFARPAAHELLDRDGGKLAGSAQARLGNALLQHGSILLEPSRAGRYLQGVPSGSGGRSSMGLRVLAGVELSREAVIDALAGAFEQAANLVGSTSLTPHYDVV